MLIVLGRVKCKELDVACIYADVGKLKVALIKWEEQCLEMRGRVRVRAWSRGPISRGAIAGVRDRWVVAKPPSAPPHQHTAHNNVYHNTASFSELISVSGKSCKHLKIVLT
jgi:hypothetical protein